MSRVITGQLRPTLDASRPSSIAVPAIAADLGAAIVPTCEAGVGKEATATLLPAVAPLAGLRTASGVLAPRSFHPAVDVASATPNAVEGAAPMATGRG